MHLSELLLSEEYTTASDVENLEITHISYRINELQAGDLFFCIKGSRLDTHTLLPTLFSRGVGAIVVEEEVAPHADSIPILRVASTRASLALAWSRYAGNPASTLSMVGVTGTNGKTSTAYLLDAVLRANGYRTAMIGTLGTFINGVKEAASEDARTLTMTTPDPDILYPFLARAKEAGVTHVIMEVSSHALALEKVTPIHFADALFTNLSPEHLDFHHDMDAYAETKKKLFRMTKHATINCDDACGAAISSAISIPQTRCGILWEADAVASLLTADEQDKYTYFYRYGDIRQLVKLSIAGNYQVYNSLLALSSAIYLGVPCGDACRALSQISYIPGRLQDVSTEEDDIRVCIDFAHTEKALRSLLTGLKRVTKGKLTVLFGCGGERDTLKRPLMGACAMQCADFSIITSDNCRGEDVTAIIKDILAGHTDATTRRVIPDRANAIRYAILSAERHDTVVLAGKGHEAYEIKRDGVHPFNETAIARSALEERRSGHTDRGDTSVL